MSLRVLHLAKEAGPLRLFVLPVCRAMRDAGAEVELCCRAGGPNYEPLAAAGFPVHGIDGGSWSRPRTWRRTYRQIRGLLSAGRYDLLVSHTLVISWIARAAARLRGGLGVSSARPGLRTHPAADPAVGVSADREARRPMDRRGDGDEPRRRTGLPDVQAHPQRRAVVLRPRRGGGRRRVGRAAEGRRARARWTPSSACRLPARWCCTWAGSSPPSGRRTSWTWPAARGRASITSWPARARSGRPCRPRRGPSGRTSACWAGPTRPASSSGGATWRCSPACSSRACRASCWRPRPPASPWWPTTFRGSSDAVADGQTGLLVRPRDVEGFCRAAVELLNDPARRRRLGLAGAARVAQRFSLAASVRAQLAATAAALRHRGLEAPWDAAANEGGQP